MTGRGIVLALAGLAAACSSPQRTARADLEAAERALTSLPAEARQVVPDQVAALDEAVKAGRQALESGDYAAASASLHGIPNQVKFVLDSLPVRSAALRAEMDTLAVVVPRNLEAIQAELDRIRRTGKLPGGMDRKGLEEVRQIRDSAAAEWSQVTSLFQAGHLGEAMARAHELKARVSRALLALGLVADERAWSNVTLPPR
jgi:hypothetical protein